MQLLNTQKKKNLFDNDNDNKLILLQELCEVNI
jgi:hypothetical protein